MGAFILVLVAVFAISESGQFNNIDNTNSYQKVAFVDIDEGDIGQIFGTTYEPVPIQVVEAPVIVQVQQPVDCYQTDTLVRDLTIPFHQRSYIRADGTFCTPVE